MLGQTMTAKFYLMKHYFDTTKQKATGSHVPYDTVVFIKFLTIVLKDAHLLT